MSTLEVLQSFPTKRKDLLTALGALDPDNTNLIDFNVENYKSRLPHKLVFQVVSTLEVLQSFPTQRKNLLTALGALDPDNTNLIHFNVENYNPRLLHKLAFQIITKLVGKKVF